MAKPLIGSIDIISTAWQNLIKHWRAYAELVIWSAFVSLIYWIIGILTRTYTDDVTIAGLVYSLATLPVSILVAIITIAFTDLTAKALQDKKVDVRESMMVGVHKLFSFIWLVILITLVNLAGFILFIIPAIIFDVWFAFATNAFVVDGIKGRGALAASRALVVGRWWGVLARLVLPGAFIYLAVRFALALAYLLFGSVLGDPGLFFGPVSDLYAVSRLQSLAMTVIPQIFVSFGVALFTAANLVLWFDLKKKPRVELARP